MEMKSTNGIQAHKFKAPSWSWLAMPLEDAVVTVKSAAKGGILGAVFGYMSIGFPIDIPTEAPFMPYRHPQDFVSPLAWSRNFAILTGVNAGINCIMKRERGKEDVQSRMLAGFGSGAMFSLVSGFGAPCEVGNMVTQGLFWAAIRGGLFKVGEIFSKPPVENSAEDVMYYKTRSMLSGLGFQNYEKNFKKGLLTDKTLPLLTDRALREVGIPPGPRLLILDRIQSPAGEQTKDGRKKTRSRRCLGNSCIREPSSVHFSKPLTNIFETIPNPRDPLAMARNISIVTSVNTALKRIMKRVRGKEDVQSSMVAAFGSSAMHSLARGFDPPNEVGSLVATGLLFALVQGGLFKMGEKFSKPQDKDAYNKSIKLEACCQALASRITKRILRKAR